MIAQARNISVGIRNVETGETEWYSVALWQGLLAAPGPNQAPQPGIVVWYINNNGDLMIAPRGSKLRIDSAINSLLQS